MLLILFLRVRWKRMISLLSGLLFKTNWRSCCLCFCRCWWRLSASKLTFARDDWYAVTTVTEWKKSAVTFSGVKIEFIKWQEELAVKFLHIVNPSAVSLNVQTESQVYTNTSTDAEQTQLIYAMLNRRSDSNSSTLKNGGVSNPPR